MEKRKMSFMTATLPILVLLLTGAFSVFYWRVGMMVPLISGVVATGIIGYVFDFSWDELLDGLKEGVTNALPAIFILLIVGTIIGTWILSGTIPAMIFYGLKFLTPSLFIPLAALITAIVSTTLGTSFTSIATVGIALIAVGNAMGFATPLTAAAIISGAFFGDKLSPLSDTTNIAAAMADCTLFEHVGHMLWDTIPAFIISLIIYWGVGQAQVGGGFEGTQQINTLMQGLESMFNITPLLFILPLITIVLAVRQTPAIPALLSMSILGGIFAMVFQSASLVEVLSSFTSGFSSNSDIGMINSLLSKGGITSMGGTIILLIIAAALGGIMQKVGILDTILEKMMSWINSTRKLLVTSLMTAFLIGLSTGAQVLAIIIPAKMFSNSFKEMGLHTKNLSRNVEAGGTVGITLVPWSVPAIFAAGMLGAQPAEFIPYLFFPMLVILINIFYGLTGISIAKVDVQKEVNLRRDA
ncbi:MAG: Na+/H+ antiporter NhaC [Halanaerobiales bacterium]|nr:Na+/H+ antiporter NhaC [Halanaerobiales bacterium]